MKEIEYKLLGVDDLELLVKIRIKDLKMFSNQKITNSTIENIRVFYKEKKTDDRADTIRFIVEKRLPSVEENIYYKSIYNFYKHQSKRSILIDNIPTEVPVYWGKDVRKFNKDLLNHTLHKFYLNFMNEMNNGFDKIIVTSEQDYDKIKVIINFMCINNVKVEMKG